MRRELSCSLLLRLERSESSSSTNITLGLCRRAQRNSARTIFSPSPTHLLVRVDALTLKKALSVYSAEAEKVSCARALASRVFPVPGGPNSSTPFGGFNSPQKMSEIGVVKVTMWRHSNEEDRRWPELLQLAEISNALAHLDVAWVGPRPPGAPVCSCRSLQYHPR